MKKLVFLIGLLFPFILKGEPVLVTIPPQEEWVERLGGGKIAVEVLVPTGADPHTYEPSPRVLKGIEKARLYLAIGSGIEFEVHWVPRIRALNPDLEIVYCFEGVEVVPGDPHVWLSLRNAEVAITRMAEVLKRTFPQWRDDIEANAEAYRKELRELDRRISRKLEPYRGKAFLSFHPAWTYFARDYGLRQLVVEREGKEPGARTLTEVIEEAKREGIRVIFVPPRFNRRLVEGVAGELGAQIRVLDPLRGDYLRNMEEVAEEIARSFRWR